MGLKGSPGKQESGNKAYPWVQQNFGQSGADAFNGGLSNIMGILTGSDGGKALDNWWKSSGGNFLLNQGTDQINANMYARGLGKSGADMKGLEQYRQGLADTKLNEVLQNFMGVSKLGLGAGDLVSNAGQYSKGSGGSQGSLGSIMQGIGALAAFI